jgi:hypothetical protein
LRIFWPNWLVKGAVWNDGPSAQLRLARGHEAREAAAFVPGWLDGGGGCVAGVFPGGRVADLIEKPLCATCRFAVPASWREGAIVWRYACVQVGRGWLKTCPQYEREPGADDE